MTVEKREVLTMETMNIALSAEMKAYIQEQVALGGFSSISEYMRSLIREDQRSKTEAQLEALLIEGLQGAPPTEMTKKDWDLLRERVRRGKGRRRARDAKD